MNPFNDGLPSQLRAIYKFFLFLISIIGISLPIYGSESVPFDSKSALESQDKDRGDTSRAALPTIELVDLSDESFDGLVRRWESSSHATARHGYCCEMVRRINDTYAGAPVHHIVSLSRVISTTREFVMHLLQTKFAEWLPSEDTSEDNAQETPNIRLNVAESLQWLNLCMSEINGDTVPDSERDKILIRAMLRQMGFNGDQYHFHSGGSVRARELYENLLKELTQDNEENS